MQLPHTVISNSEKLTHPSVYSANAFISTGIRIIIGGGFFHAIQIWTGVESVLIILPTVKIIFFYFLFFQVRIKQILLANQNCNFFLVRLKHEFNSE